MRVAAALWLLVAVRAAASTERVDLSGPWEVAETLSASAAAPEAGWKPFGVPGLLTSTAEGGARYGWYRRDIAIPAGWAGRRFFLRLGGARWDARVFLDGAAAGARLEGFTPWRVELTDRVRPGGTHRLAIRCRDWSATFADGFTLPERVTGDLRYATGGRTIAPVGGHHTHYGLWDDVALEATPPAFLDDVAIVPSVRAGRLTVSGGVDGPASGGRVDAQVLDGDRTLLALPPVRIAKDGRWTLGAPFPDAPRWSPEDPHRLTLRLTLHDRDGGVLDVREDRFGFRELWAAGPDFILNGVKRHLLATAAWPSTQTQTREQVRTIIRQVKDGHAIAMRLHTQPWREVWLDEADAAGLLIVDEAALWCDGGGGYGYKDPRFWTNYREHVAAMIRRDRNHPALVMWSLENELLHCGGGGADPRLERKLGDLARFARALDPSHLITFEADLDPDGAADVIGLHYPHELPDYPDWPDTADWLDSRVLTGTGGGLMGSRGAAFRWDRKKPLYIGEFLWVPDGSAAPGAVYFGDAAFADVSTSNWKAKAACWEDQILAYRRAGVSGQCPWTQFEGHWSAFPLDLAPASNPFYQAEARAYVPVAAFIRERDTRFRRNEVVTRTFDVFNDAIAPARLSVDWSLSPGGPNGSATLTLEPGGRAAVPVRVTAAATATLATFSAVLIADGFKVHAARQTWALHPDRPLHSPAGWRTAFWPGTNRGQFQPGVMAFTIPISRLDEADPARDLLVVAPFQLSGAPGRPWEAPGDPVIGLAGADIDVLTSFLRRGGRTLILPQQERESLFGLDLVTRNATMTFALAPGHPLLSGLGPDDLRFWRHDGDGQLVARGGWLRPERAGALAVLAAGGPDGLDASPLVDLPVGAGRAILMQALAVQKIPFEPAAARLVQNALDVLAAHRPPAGATRVLADDPAFLRRLDDVAVDAQPVTADAPDLAQATLVILHGGGDTLRAAAPAIRAWLGPGRTLYWHLPEPGAFAAMRDGLRLDGLEIRPAQGPVAMADRASPLLAGVSREDLRFLGPVMGDAWMRRADPDPAVIDRACFPAGIIGGATTLRPGDLELSGEYVARLPDGSAIGLYTNGEVRGTVRISTAGLHAITVRASGTAMAGIWPALVLRAGGAEIGRLTLTRSAPGEYTTLARLPAGSVTLTAAFVNDAADGREDRNCLIHAVAVGRTPWRTAGLEVLTLPASLVIGNVRGGRVVVDTLRWDRPGANRVRAGRYASALLRNLGAAFAPERGRTDWIPAGAFRQAGAFANFTAGPRGLQFGSEGAAAARFTCASAGRYVVRVRGSSSPVDGGYGRARVTVDDRPAGDVEVAAESSAVFATGATVDLTAGPHTVSVAFTNDLYRPPEDRNLTISAVGFSREGE